MNDTTQEVNILKAIFAVRREVILNGLTSGLPMTKEEAHSVIVQFEAAVMAFETAVRAPKTQEG